MRADHDHLVADRRVRALQDSDHVATDGVRGFVAAGVRVRDVRYIASQPWPFPSQLMIGCHAKATSDVLAIDPNELEDARWFARAEVAEAIENGVASTGLKAPTSRAIAHYLLRWWLEETR